MKRSVRKVWIAAATGLTAFAVMAFATTKAMDVVSSSGTASEPTQSRQSPRSKNNQPAQKLDPGNKTSIAPQQVPDSSAVPQTQHPPRQPMAVSVANLPEFRRSAALWPHPSEMEALRSEAMAGKRPEMYQARRVAELYLLDRYAGTDTAKAGDFVLNEGSTRIPGRASFRFEGGNDVEPGAISLHRYDYRSNPTGDIWYVSRAESEVFHKAGVEEEYDLYQNSVLRITFTARKAGSVDFFVQGFGRQEPVLKKTVEVSGLSEVVLKERFPERFTVLVKGTFRSRDGKVGITEFAREHATESS